MMFRVEIVGKRDNYKKSLFKQGTRESVRIFNVIYSCF